MAAGTLQGGRGCQLTADVAVVGGRAVSAASTACHGSDGRFLRGEDPVPQPLASARRQSPARFRHLHGVVLEPPFNDPTGDPPPEVARPPAQILPPPQYGAQPPAPIEETDHRLRMLRLDNRATPVSGAQVRTIARRKKRAKRERHRNGPKSGATAGSVDQKNLTGNSMAVISQSWVPGGATASGHPAGTCTSAMAGR